MTDLSFNETVTQTSVQTGDEISYNPMLMVDARWSYLFLLINISILGISFALIGVFINIVNVIIFARNGFKDTVNVCLFFLSVTDIGALVPYFVSGALNSPAVYEAGVPVIPQEVCFLISDWPHLLFARATGWITAFIMFQRCLCLVFPLQVKVMVTHVRVKVIIALIYAVHILGLIPEYATTHLAWRYVPSLNRTMLGYYYSPDSIHFTSVTEFCYNVISPFLSFAIIIVCVCFIVKKINEKSLWRQTTTSLGQTKELFTRKDRNVIKLVTTIATIYIACNIPTIIGFVFTTVEPQIGVTGKYRNLLTLMFTFIFMCETIHPITNGLVYYNMNSKYRREFLKIFSRGETPISCGCFGTQS